MKETSNISKLIVAFSKHAVTMATLALSNLLFKILFFSRKTGKSVQLLNNHYMYNVLIPVNVPLQLLCISLLFVIHAISAFDGLMVLPICDACTSEMNIQSQYDVKTNP